MLLHQRRAIHGAAGSVPDPVSYLPWLCGTNIRQRENMPFGDILDHLRHHCSRYTLQPCTPELQSLPRSSDPSSPHATSRSHHSTIAACAIPPTYHLAARVRGGDSGEHVKAAETLSWRGAFFNALSCASSLFHVTVDFSTSCLVRYQKVEAFTFASMMSYIRNAFDPHTLLCSSNVPSCLYSVLALSGHVLYPHEQQIAHVTPTSQLISPHASAITRCIPASSAKTWNGVLIVALLCHGV